MYFLFYIPSTLFLHHPISQKYGTKGVLVIGALISILSLWLRVATKGSGGFTCAFFSNIFGAISFPLFVNEIPRMVRQRFRSEQVIYSYLHL